MTGAHSWNLTCRAHTLTHTPTRVRYFPQTQFWKQLRGRRIAQGKGKKGPCADVLWCSAESPSNICKSASTWGTRGRFSPWGHGNLASLSHLQTEEGHEPLVHPGVWQLPGSSQRQSWVRGVSQSLGFPGAGTCGQQLPQVQGRLVQFRQLQLQGRKPLLPLSLCLFPRRALG